MSEVIRHEIWFFFFSLLSGVILLCAYDQLRVLRRVIPHNGFFQSLEDFFFWTAAGIFCFGVSFRGNSGAIRGFSLAALVFGMWVYHRTGSPWVITCETFVFCTASKKTVFLCRKALKKAWNWVTMKNTCKNVGVKRKKQGSE